MSERGLRLSVSGLLAGGAKSRRDTKTRGLSVAQSTRKRQSSEKAFSDIACLARRPTQGDATKVRSQNLAPSLSSRTAGAEFALWTKIVLLYGANKGTMAGRRAGEKRENVLRT